MAQGKGRRFLPGDSFRDSGEDEVTIKGESARKPNSSKGTPEREGEPEGKGEKTD